MKIVSDGYCCTAGVKGKGSDECRVLCVAYSEESTNLLHNCHCAVMSSTWHAIIGRITQV